MLRLIIISVLISFSAAGYPNKIIGGEPTTIEEHPYQLSLELSGQHFCGGSIIGVNKALTAAHCFNRIKDPVYLPFLAVRAGSTYRGMGGQVIQVASICLHPDYNSQKYNNDVAVLVLKSSFVFGSGVQIIPLVGIGQRPDVGALGTVTGWGHTYIAAADYEAILPSELHKVLIPRYSQTDCEKVYSYGNYIITDRMICFGHMEGGKDSCQGDSGGPLVTDGKLSGVVSFGMGCAMAFIPGVYADLSSPHLRDHIDSC